MMWNYGSRICVISQWKTTRYYFDGPLNLKIPRLVSNADRSFHLSLRKIWMSVKGIVIDFSYCEDRMEYYDCRRNELEIRDWALMDAPARHPKTSPNESTNSSFFRIVWSKFCSRSEPYQLFREIILPGNVFNC